MFPGKVAQAQGLGMDIFAGMWGYYSTYYKRAARRECPELKTK